MVPLWQRSHRPLTKIPHCIGLGSRQESYVSSISYTGRPQRPQPPVRGIAAAFLLALAMTGCARIGLPIDGAEAGVDPVQTGSLVSAKVADKSIRAIGWRCVRPSARYRPVPPRGPASTGERPHQLHGNGCDADPGRDARRKPLPGLRRHDQRPPRHTALPGPRLPECRWLGPLQGRPRRGRGSLGHRLIKRIQILAEASLTRAR